MRNAKRKAAFVLAATNHGPLIVNRYDFRAEQDGRAIGVGLQLLENSVFDPQEVGMATTFLELRRRYHGDGVVAIDCGANIGVHTVEWAVTMTGWGSVVAIEAQERVFYALAGNIALNNCFNARALYAAVAAQDGTLRIPQPDYQVPGSFGSLELRRRPNTEYIGQPIDYAEEAMTEVRTIALDSLALPRVDLMKIDVEGMEEEVLAGAEALFSAHRPIVIVEWIKTSKPPLMRFFTERDYEVFEDGLNLVAVHRADPCLGHVKMPNSGGGNP